MSDRSRKTAAGEDNIATASDRIATDWKFNGRLEAGRVRCHGAGDLVVGPNCDWARVYGRAALLQKLIIYFAIPKGEVMGQPDMGCCLHNYLFDRITSSSLVEMQTVMTAELQEQIPELGVHRVQAERSADKDSVRLIIVGHDTWIFDVSREDLLEISLLEAIRSIS